jgi:hypothetical protein
LGPVFSFVGGAVPPSDHPPPLQPLRTAGLPIRSAPRSPNARESCIGNRVQPGRGPFRRRTPELNRPSVRRAACVRRRAQTFTFAELGLAVLVLAPVGGSLFQRFERCRTGRTSAGSRPNSAGSRKRWKRIGCNGAIGLLQRMRNDERLAESSPRGRNGWPTDATDRTTPEHHDHPPSPPRPPALRRRPHRSRPERRPAAPRSSPIAALQQLGRGGRRGKRRGQSALIAGLNFDKFKGGPVVSLSGTGSAVRTILAMDNAGPRDITATLRAAALIPGTSRPMGSFGTSTAGTDVFEFAVGAVGPKGDTGAQGRSGLTAPLARAAISPSSKTGTRLSTRIPAQRTVDGAESGCRPPAGRYFKSRLLHRGINPPPQRHPAMLCDGALGLPFFCLPAPMRRRPR